MRRILWIIFLVLGSTSLLKAQSDTVTMANPHLVRTNPDTAENCLAPSVTVTATADTVCTGESVTIQAVVSANGLVPPSVAVGDILCTDSTFVKPSAWAGSGQTALGVVFFVDSTGLHGWAVNLTDQTSSLKWSNSNEDVPNLTNRASFFSSTDSLSQYSGYFNTQCMLDAGTAVQYPVAYGVDFENGWYVPDIVQLNLLMSQFFFVNPTLQLLGSSFNMTQSYWSSTEHSSSKAWMMSLIGRIEIENKSNSHLVRSIRNF